ncbi:hypothetical protein AB4156_00975 [Cupriavidus sp. 2MCAB6]|uniref:hypothetical protein n=1 Tax=Cupriavidus sp. 2MCAB6 TaxID=3232981 RepID=UPI003F907CB2
MSNKLIKTLFSATILGTALLSMAQAGAVTVKDSTFSGDESGYNLHVGTRDPYTDGARVDDARDPYTDGARIGTARDPYTDGARSQAVNTSDKTFSVAGRDRTGVSAPPANASDNSEQAA